jgi:hypothetical protein
MVIKMSEKTKLTELFAALQSDMTSKANFSSVLNHPTDMGDNSEESWIKWFSDYLPHRYKAAKATIIDSKGNISDQIDLVLYDAQYSYLAFNENGILYIPAESVYAVFEIKQELNKAYMEYAGKKTESVRKLYRTSAAIPYAGGTYPPKPLHRILSGILTTRSGWNEPYSDPFKKCIEAYTTDQQVDCGCVLTGGSFFYDYKNNTLRKCGKDESLVYFFLQLLILLQNMGTVPAIDLAEYMKALTIEEELLINGKTE